MLGMFSRVASLALVLAASLPLAAQDSGSSATTPWSGYWWPHRSSGLVPVYKKYDLLLGTKAAEWEQMNNVNPALAAEDSDWWGKCNAWSAASTTEKEPRQGTRIKDIDFTVGDLKGLLTACHEQDSCNFYGDRYGGEGDDISDLSPDALWRVLQLYLGRDRIPLILDLDAGQQVWNYPAYQYRVDYEPAADGWANCTMQILVAEDDVAPDYVGTRAALHTYTFRAKMENGAIVEGTGEWTGQSVHDHPDFAWYPQVAQAENPHVDIAQVAKIVGYAVGGENPPIVDPATPTPDTPGSGNPGSGPGVSVPPPPVITQVTPGQEVQFANMLSPQELLSLVTNRTSHFKLDAFIEGGDGAKFDAGRPIKISVVSGEKGYLYVFDIDADGDLSLVFPLGGESNLVDKGKQFDVPPRLLASGHGQHDLKSIVLARPLTLTGFSGHQQEQAQKPGQTKPQDQVQQPQKLRVCHTTRTRARGRLLGFFRKGIEEDPQTPGKVARFAQDSTSYFVFDLKGKPRPGQQSGLTPAGPR